MAQNEKSSKLEAQLEGLIAKAIAKVGGKKESDICHYIPVSPGGYMHHFTLRKLKHKNPSQLFEMIEKYITSNSKPSRVAPKQRAPRGSRKRKDQIVLSKLDIDRMLHMARMAGDKDMIRKLTPRRDLRAIKRELISSIRHNRVEPELWNSYVESLNNQAALSGLVNPAAAAF